MPGPWDVGRQLQGVDLWRFHKADTGQASCVRNLLDPLAARVPTGREHGRAGCAGRIRSASSWVAYGVSRLIGE
jgi:hypothetical protein